MAFIGQRLLGNTSNPHYVRHPAANTGWLQNGQPLDAGSVMIVDNNLSHLNVENLRHLVSSQNWSFNTGDAVSINYGWSAFPDLDVPTSPTTEHEYNQIAWTRPVSVRWGPFAIPVDKALTGGRATIRDIKVNFSFYNATNNSPSKFYCFLTDTEVRPNDPAGGYLAGTSYSNAVLNYNTCSLTLTCSQAMSDGNNHMTATPTGDAVYVQQVYLWFGFAYNHVSSSWTSLDAFETR